MEHKKQLECVYPIKASVIGACSAKSIKALNWKLCRGETGVLYQHDPRHVDVLIESLGLEKGNKVQTPMPFARKLIRTISGVSGLICWIRLRILSLWK